MFSELKIILCQAKQGLVTVMVPGLLKGHQFVLHEIKQDSLTTML